MNESHEYQIINKGILDFCFILVKVIPLLKLGWLSSVLPFFLIVLPGLRKVQREVPGGGRDSERVRLKLEVQVEVWFF